MDKNQAISLIENTLGAKFDKDKFTYFIKNLLNDMEPKSNRYSGQMLWDSYKDHINSYKRIGKYTDPKGESLDILIVEVKTIAKLERARTSLRNFVIKHLKKFHKDYALVAFYSNEDGGADWRFSFVKLEYQSYLDEERGTVRTEEEFTPAKRYSFLVGEYEQSHTAKTQILPILQNIADNPTVEDIENAFSIEKVTDEFFNQYKDLYVKLYEYFNNDNHINQELKKADIDNARFTKKLLGQIVFLYFLQKKGWLGVPENKKWGKGEKRFIQNLFTISKEQNKNFFKDNLQYLFYEALAEERNNEHSFYKRFNCRIPFLNGGLFEAEYDWQDANITIPENLFRNQEKNKAGDIGTGVLDVFDRYNFTIKEDEPLDKEVAVDPEMLGKVFENMLEITERKSKGAFYTPREIVHYMCQESLIHYLDNALEGKVNKQDIEIYIRKGHNALENDQRVAKKGKTKTYKYILPESIRENADLIDQKLTEIKICDPAIGSGAFPVGLLHELVNAQLVIKPHFTDRYITDKLKKFGFSENEQPSESRYIYRLKRHIIQESIYGVDIDASAIDIARLRLWLSLVVDEDGFDPIETLPNLDYKIVCGNSLISRYSLDIPIDNVFKEFNKKVKDKDYNNQDIKNLVGNKDIDLAYYKKLTNDFLLESSHKKKVLFRELISEIKNAFKTSLNKREKEKISKARGTVENLQQSDIFGKQVGTKTQISKAKKLLAKLEKEKQEIEEGVLFNNAIEWRFEFPNLLDDNGDFIGFDIVIGNPPYIMEDENKQAFIGLHNHTCYQGKTDIWHLFTGTGINLLKVKATVSFIAKNQWMNSFSSSKMRRTIYDNSKIKQIIDFGMNLVFKNADVQTMFFFLQKALNENDYSFEYVRYNDRLNVKNILSSLSKKIEKNEMLEIFKKTIPSDYSEKENLTFSSSQNEMILKTIDSKKNFEFNEKKEIIQGLIGGPDKAFLIDKKRINEINTIEKGYLNELHTNTKKYFTEDSNKYFFYISKNNCTENDIERCSIIIELLSKYKEKLVNRREVLKNRIKWFHLWWARDEEFFKKGAKLVWAKRTEGQKFTYTENPLYGTANLFFIKSSRANLKYITALLNSELMCFFMRERLKHTGILLQIDKNQFMKIPLFIPLKINYFEIIVDYIITSKQIESKDIQSNYFEAVIDAMVYELYFPKELKQANKQVLKHLTDIKPINDNISEEEKLAIIQVEFERLHHPEHPVRFAVDTLDSIEEVRIIKEALK